MASQKDGYIISYTLLRKMVGWVAIALPFAVYGGGYLEGIAMLGSVSSDHYTCMRDVFVGLLCAAGIFLCCYRGVERKDTILAFAAGAAVIAIALLPMEPTYAPTIQQRYPAFNDTACYVTRGPLKFHDPVSVVFFVLIGYMTIFRFPRTKETLITPQKQWRNLIYAVCGVAMVLGVVLIAILGRRGISIFWPETLAIGAFGVAWLTKGQLVLQDNESERTIKVAEHNLWGWGKARPRRGSPAGA